MNTYGFRGEALASISQVAYLTVISKTSDSPCAYKSIYTDGKVTENPKPCAGTQGTCIIVEELFYNMDVRRQALRSQSEEFNRIYDVVSRYAVHHAKVGFLLKKQGESSAEIRTESNSTVLTNIGRLFGQTIVKELIDFQVAIDRLGFKVDGYVTHANFSQKKFNFLLFINHRAVECGPLKKSIELLYANYLPKNAFPFLYIQIEIRPDYCRNFKISKKIALVLHFWPEISLKV